jgi:hypothetical protein
VDYFNHKWVNRDDGPPGAFLYCPRCESWWGHHPEVGPRGGARFRMFKPGPTFLILSRPIVFPGPSPEGYRCSGFFA